MPHRKSGAPVNAEKTLVQLEVAGMKTSPVTILALSTLRIAREVGVGANG